VTRARAAAAALLGGAVALACASPATNSARTEEALVQVTEGRPAMGTVLEITLIANDEARARELIARCFAETERLEMIFTTWRADGELARLNAKAGRGPQWASPELVQILRDARDMRGDSPFDVTVGPLVQLWREAGERGAPPSEEEIARARGLVGSERIRIDARASTIALEAGMSADLGGIAKGWTLDRLRELLRSEGVRGALLNFGGSSLAAIGTPLDAAAWRVSLPEGVLELSAGANASISESFGQVIEIAGQRFSHIVDPRSGRALERDLRVIAWAPSGALAEVWSTALVVIAAHEECEPGVTRSVSRTSASGRVDAKVDCAR
jgi:thiamine biosynthesis lipoprotein